MKIATPVGLSHRGRLRFLLKDAALYGGAASISKAFSLITFPLLARHFSVADFGVVDYFLVLTGFATILFIFGQDSAVARFFYEHEDAAERRQLISQSLVFQLAGVVLFLPVLWIAAGWLTRFLIDAEDTERLLRIVLLQLPFLLLINFSQNLLKWTFARFRFVAMSLGYTIVQASLLLVAVLGFRVGVEGVLLVSLATSFLFGLLGLYFVRGWLARPRGLGHLREMLPFAAPFGVICVLGAFSPTLERSLTDRLLGAEEMGLYAAGTKVAMLVGLVVGAFQTSWGPFSLSLHKQADAARTYNWVLKLFALGMCVTVLGLALVAGPVIDLLASNRYSGAAVVVFPLAMGLAIQATSWITEIGIGIGKRSYLHLYAYAIAVAATLGGILLLAPALGLLGVAMGVLVGHAARAFTSSWLAQRAYPLPWHYAPAVATLGFTLAWGMVGIWAETRWGSGAQALIIGVGMALLMIAGWSLLLDRAEKEQALLLLHSWRTRLRAS